MAYESYRNQGQQAGYGQSNTYSDPSPYGHAGNPYDDTSYGGGNPYTQGQYDRQEYEMSNMDGTDPNRILNETRAIDATLAQLKQEQEQLRQMQSVYLNAVQDKQTAASLKAVTDGNEELMRQFRQLVARTKRMKQDKESGNPRNSPQVGRVDRAVKQALNDFQKLDSEFRKGAQERTRRDYLIVRPDASEAEIREAIQDPDQQVFSQALMRSDRRGDARETLDNVRARHAAIAKIEADMIKLAEMFQDLDALVIQQEAPVTEIERRGEEVTDHVTKANVELDGAVKKARAARKKKWICLGIAAAVLLVLIIIIVIVVYVRRGSILIIIIIVVVVVVAVEVTKR